MRMFLEKPLVKNFTKFAESFHQASDWIWDNPRLNFAGRSISAQEAHLSHTHNVMKYLSLGSKMKVFILMFSLIVVPSFAVFGYCYYKDYNRKKLIQQELIDKDKEQKKIIPPRKIR